MMKISRSSVWLRRLADLPCHCFQSLLCFDLNPKFCSGNVIVRFWTLEDVLCGKVLIFNGLLLRFAVDLYDDHLDDLGFRKTVKNCI